MNWVDWAVLAVVVVSALLGMARGFVREVLGLGAWVGAAAIAFAGFGSLLPLVESRIDDPNFAVPVAFGAIFIVALIILSLLANLLARLVRGSTLASLDHALGAVFGVARGAVLLIAAYIAAGWAVPVERWPPVVAEARALPIIYRGATWVADKVPPAYRPQVAPPPGAHGPSEQALLHATPQGHAMDGHATGGHAIGR